MDLNYLLYRQQVELSRAGSASCEHARKAHAQLAALYEKAIERHAKGNLSPLGSRERRRARYWLSAHDHVPQICATSEAETVSA